jgi:hypothetical protein
MKTFHSLALFVLLGRCGCASYVTPGRRADFIAMAGTDPISPELKTSFDSQPAATFPAGIAAVRVQAANYSNYFLERHGGKHGSGRYSVITTREVETDEQIARLSKLPNVDGLVGLSTLLLPEHLTSEKDLRVAAARLKADMLLLYTFQTSYYTRDPAIPVSMLTLGLSPNRKVNVSVNLSALVIDVRTGFIYGALESNERRSHITNLWQNRGAADAARRAAEQAAFEKLVGEFERFWPKLTARYAKAD